MSEPCILAPADVDVLLAESKRDAVMDSRDWRDLDATVRAAWAERDYWKRYAEDSDAQALEWRRQRDEARCWARMWKAGYRRYRDGYQHADGDRHFLGLKLADEQEWRKRAEAEVEQYKALVERHREDSKP